MPDARKGRFCDAKHRKFWLDAASVRDIFKLKGRDISFPSAMKNF